MIRDEIVVARYNEDLAWTEGLPVKVYNKGSPNPGSDWVHLPNVGREAHTFLWHIVHHWDDLADVTVFCQGKNDDHMAPGFRVEQLLEQRTGIAGATLLTGLREWNEKGELQFWSEWFERMRSGEILKSRWSMHSWFQEFVGLNLNDLKFGMAYFPGAIFSAAREVIQQRPQMDWERLLNTVSHHAHPEEAHFVERAWIYLFGLRPTVGRVFGTGLM